MFGVNLIGIIADDLTGANDTALQFHMHGCNTQIVLNSESSLNETNLKNAQACAISTETRNSDFNSAYQKTKAACQKLYDNFNIEYLYKKIDSTLRGNIAVEIKAILDVVNNDAAIVVPAFPKENRYTIGSYHLLKGVPIERTELARDPKFPIYESHIPSILEKQLKEFGSDLKIGTIGFKTVVKGAALILTEMHRLINEGVKIIVIDAQSSIDMEQIALAVKKSTFNLLPVGAAGFAAALSNIWLNDAKNNKITLKLHKQPKFIVSGSATELTASQIARLKDEYDDCLYSYSVKIDDIIKGVNEEFIERIRCHLSKGSNVLVHTSDLIQNREEFQQFLMENEISYESFLTKISGYLANLVELALNKISATLILIGGETSYECCNALNSEILQVIDEVTYPIPLCMDYKAQLIVTKSGNLGNANTLVDIIKYFDCHDEQ